MYHSAAAAAASDRVRRRTDLVLESLTFVKKKTALFVTGVLGGVVIAALPLATGGCADAYRRYADRDVYRILEDRKKAALAYDPQAVTEPVIKPSPGPFGINQPTIDAVEGAPKLKDHADALGPVPARAYEPIPVTPLPPMATPALDLKPGIAPWQPLGPFLDELDDDQVIMDPFASEMATRWNESRMRYGPSSPQNKPINLDLFESLRYAVRHNRTYRNRMDDLYLAALDVTLERRLLSPRPFAGGSLQYSGGQNDSDYRSALTATMNAGVRQRLPYGGEVVAQTLVSFVNALDGNVDDGESASAVLSGSIPLLRGAGMINLEPLIQSERDVVYTVRSFEEFRRVFVIDIANAYFRLLASYQSVNNRRTNLQNSQSLLDRTRAIYAANLGGGGAVQGRGMRLTFLEVQRSEQQLLDAQNSLIDAQEAYLNDLDDFKILLGMNVRQEVEIIPVALEVNIPELDGYDVIAVANRFRLDLQTARDRIDDARRQVKNAENGLLPDLSIVGRGEIGNRDETSARALDSRTLTYSGGLQLDLPVDRVAERNVLRRAMVNFHQSQRSYQDLAERVAADVRTAVRLIRSSQVSLAIQKRSMELAQRRLDNSNLLLKRGETNARDVVESQQALIRAQDAYERARADLQVQVLQFLRQTGTLRVDPESGEVGRAMDRRQPLQDPQIEQRAEPRFSYSNIEPARE